MTLPTEVLARCERLPKKPAEVVLAGSKVELRPVTGADFRVLDIDWRVRNR